MQRFAVDRLVATLAVGAAAVISGCGPPVLYDTDLQPVRNPLITASVENGWLAVDSTEAGVRAVLELQVEASEIASEYVALHVPTLHCSSRGVHEPAKVRHGQPVCSPPDPALYCSPTEREAGDCPQALTQLPETCVYTVRAEYAFERVPHLDESHYFTFAQRATPIYWTRKDP
ncbi:MAG: hypothetical protein R3266_12880 [Gemmatimonadota bacterium]|nr:hypothetical protein [Gemmatimonadota bacterium]